MKRGDNGKDGGAGADPGQPSALPEQDPEAPRYYKVVETLRRDLVEREGSIRELEASLELEGRVSATLRESLRKLTERIGRLEEAVERSDGEHADASEDSPAIETQQQAVGNALEEAQAALARVTAERDALASRLRELERMQTDTLALDEEEDSVPSGAGRAELSIDELLEGLSAIERPGLAAGLGSLPGSGPGERRPEEPWSEMIAPELMAPEAFGEAREEEDATSSQPRPAAEARDAVYGFLVGLDGERPARYALIKQVTTVGRAPNCDIQINASHMSRMHARILSDASSIIVEDAGSKNGVCVNREPVERSPLAPGDIVHFGPLRFELRGPEEGEADTGADDEAGRAD